MVQVFITVDVEIWLGGWDRIEERFPTAFEQYIYGTTPKGQFGLPLKLKILEDYGLHADFFIESLFASIFGISPLQEIVGMIAEAQQGLQLHVHPEWVEKVPNSVIEQFAKGKDEDYSIQKYQQLIRVGLDNLKRSGVPEVSAFRAGSYQITPRILKALSQIPINIDTSYNAAYLERCSRISPNQLLLQPTEIDRVMEYPVSVFRDCWGRIRPMQISASSYGEMIDFLWKALDGGWDSVVIVSHNFELMDSWQKRPSSINVKRFRKLCAFLDKQRNNFQTKSFSQLSGLTPLLPQPTILSPKFMNSIVRLVEQGAKRLFE